MFRIVARMLIHRILVVIDKILLNGCWGVQGS